MNTGRGKNTKVYIFVGSSNAELVHLQDLGFFNELNQETDSYLCWSVSTIFSSKDKGR